MAWSDRVAGVTSAAWRLIVPIPAGLALGFFSAFGDGLPADTLLHVLVALANAAGPWFVVAFCVGALQPRPLRGAGAGTVALVVAVIGYYLGIYLGGHSVAELARALIAWSVVGILVGPLLGASGAWWAGARSGRVLGLGFLTGSLMAEAAFRLVQHQFWTGIDLARTDPQVALVDGLAALLLPWLLLPRSDRLAAYGATAVLGLIGSGAVWAVTELARSAVA
jgi:hypothetical protein